MKNHPIPKKVTGFLRLFRFELPFTAGICVIVGQILALDALPTLPQMVFGFLAVFLVSASALILNDYFDVESDRINAPHRPVPAGLVSKGEVLALFILVSLAGFLFGALIHLLALVVLILVWTVGVLYNWRFKQFGLLGNLMVSFSVGMTFIFGGVVVERVWEPAALFFGAWAFLVNLGEEIAADANDLAGDQPAGARSLAVLWGPETAIRVSSGIFLLVVLGSPVPFIFGWLDWVLFIPLLLADAAILVSTIKLLHPQGSNRRQLIRWIYLSGMGALLMFMTIKVLLFLR